MKMKLKIVTLILAIVVASTLSCTDESLYPLPYNDRTTGAYLRIYKQTSNVFDLNNLAESAFEAIFEPVDENKGNDLERIDFFVSHRRGTDLTPEVFVKSVNADIFQSVPQPTYSVYKRATVRVTANEALTALQTITTDPDGDGVTPPICQACVPLKGLSAFPGSFANADQVNIRYEMVMKDGRKFSVANPQSTVNPAFANNATANSTPNITTGQFYNSPFVVIMTVRSLTANSWTGTYNLSQVALWSPSHSVALHGTAFPSHLNRTLFATGTVTLSKPAGGLSTEREFQVNYRGQNVTMRINLEDGVVWVPLQNTGINCTSTRQIYWTTPTTAAFNAAGAGLPAGLPQVNTPGRGSYNTAITGTTAGDTFFINVDDDADEYGRRNGYCSWTLRVRLQLTKL